MVFPHAPDCHDHYGSTEMTKQRNRKTERNKEIYELRKAGAYYHQIAERFNISICRVRQIIEVEEAADDR